MKRDDVPKHIRESFEFYFGFVHDEEEEWAAPDAEACEDDEECYVKIGHERMVEIFEEFVDEEPQWMRMALLSRDDDSGEDED